MTRLIIESILIVAAFVAGALCFRKNSAKLEADAATVVNAANEAKKL